MKFVEEFFGIVGNSYIWFIDKGYYGGYGIELFVNIIGSIFCMDFLVSVYWYYVFIVMCVVVGYIDFVFGFK